MGDKDRPPFNKDNGFRRSKTYLDAGGLKVHPGNGMYLFFMLFALLTSENGNYGC